MVRGFSSTTMPSSTKIQMAKATTRHTDQRKRLKIVKNKLMTTMKSLKQMRNFRGMSQRELAKRMDDHQPQIVRLEKVDMPVGVNLSTIMRINKALNCRAVIDRNKIFFEEMT